MCSVSARVPKAWFSLSMKSESEATYDEVNTRKQLELKSELESEVRLKQNRKDQKFSFCLH